MLKKIVTHNFSKMLIKYILSHGNIIGSINYLEYDPSDYVQKKNEFVDKK